MSTILLIDDEPDMGILVSMFIEDLARVVQATSAAEAPALARKEHPDLVMLDLNLGIEGDGLDRLPELRKEPELAELPVVVFSVHASREREARSRGAAGFVSKPFKADALRAQLIAHLGSAAAADPVDDPPHP